MNFFALGMGLFVLFVLMVSAQNMYDAHQKTNTSFDIYNFTENNIVWKYPKGDNITKNNNSEITELNYSAIQTQRITNLVHKFIDFCGYSMFELSKWAMEYGYTHPEYNYSYMMNLVKYLLYLIIFITIYPLLIIIFALLYLALKGMIKIFKNRKVNE